MGDCACDVTVGQPNQPAPLSHIFLELTPACNNACPGCSNVFAGDRSHKPLSAEEWEQVLKQMAPQQPRIRLTGGEPTLHPEFERIVEQVAALGLPFTLFTNARWQNPARLLAFLADVPQLEALLISLHGADADSHEAFTATRGSFAETVANIQRASRAGLKVVTSTVITKQNHNQVEDVVALSRKLGADHAVFNRYIGPPLPGLESNKTELRVTIQTIEKIANNGHEKGEPSNGHGRIRFGTPIPQCFAANSSNSCLAGRVHVAIDPWGNLHPCSHTLISAGNILTDGLEDAWRAPVLEAWRNMTSPQCVGCLAYPQCQGGCRAMFFMCEGDADPLAARLPSIRAKACMPNVVALA